MTISKNNFVTDNMTNTVCYSSLLPKESSGLDPQLREKMYAALKESVKTLKNDDLLNTRESGQEIICQCSLREISF